MKKLILLLPFFLSTMLVSGQTANEILKKVEEKLRASDSKAEVTVKTIRPTWTREMQLRSWNKGNDYSMIQVLSPARDKGTTFLKRDKEVWNWIPSIERTIKLPPSMMSQSWMGTDFTNDDLVRESSMITDYKNSILGDTVIDGRNSWIIKMIPTPEAPVVWSKTITYVDKKEYIQVLSKFFDEDGEMTNKIIFSEIKEMGGRVFPTKMEMIPQDKDGHKTVLTYNSIEFDATFPEDFFSTQNMKKLRP